MLRGSDPGLTPAVQSRCAPIGDLAGVGRRQPQAFDPGDHHQTVDGVVVVQAVSGLGTLDRLNQAESVVVAQSEVAKPLRDDTSAMVSRFVGVRVILQPRFKVKARAAFGRLGASGEPQ